MEERIEQPYFQEEQGFALWMKALMLLPLLLPVMLLGYLAIFMWMGVVLLLTEGADFLSADIIFTMSLALVFTACTLFLLLLAALAFIIKLVTRVDSSHLHVRIYSLRLPVPFLPPRIKDVSLGEISKWEVRTYRPLSDREYWGTHFFGLSRAFGGKRLMYVMKANPARVVGVELQLRSGERLLLGSKHPEELERAITLAKSESS